VARAGSELFHPRLRLLSRTSKQYALDICELYFLGFPLYHPLDGKRTLSKASTAIENQTFGARVTKIFVYEIDQFLLCVLLYHELIQTTLHLRFFESFSSIFQYHEAPFHQLF